MMERQAKSTMRFVSVVFRHGDRLPSDLELSLLSVDKRNYNNFEPIGAGGLTNEGKRRMYQLGKELRKRYADFLGDTYIPAHVEARSSDMNRTKMSLDLLLAGLYPPKESQIWNQDLKWQPIPTTSVPVLDDIWLMPLSASPEYLKELIRVGSLPEVIEKTEPFRDVAKKISNIVGFPIINMLDIWFIYHGRKGFKLLGIELPGWPEDNSRDELIYDGSCLLYDIYNWSEKLRKFNGGVLLKKMIDDMKAKINSDNVTNRRKINLYSGHDVNIAGMLQTLGLYKPHIPDYSSAVIVELIQRDETYYVKVVHYLGNPAEFVEQEISDYGTLCPLDKFVELMKNVTPSDEELERPPNSGVEIPIALEMIRCKQFQ